MVHTPQNVGYVRWSSDIQENGDSERRQRETILEDSNKLGKTISRWVQDEGLSASSGENISKGELGKFLDEVRSGAVPRGSVLFLDEPTRLTRLSPARAMRIVADLDDAGVAIRLSSRRQTLSGESLYELLGFLVESAAGHAFTMELGRKVHEAWSAKQDRARRAPGQEVITSNTPYGIAAVGGTYTVGRGWSGRRYEAHPRESGVVLIIFELARDGYSPRLIAVHLNRMGIPSPNAGRGKRCWRGTPVWRPESVRIIITDRAYVDGSYQPHKGTSKKGKAPDGERVVGHYPVFLPKGLWEAANAEMTKRGVGRSTSHRSGASNLFTGVMTCTQCGGAISLRSGEYGKRIPALYCINARVEKCTATKVVHRAKMDAAVLGDLNLYLSPEKILSNLKVAKPTVDYDAEVEELRGEVSKRQGEVARLADRILALAGSDNLDLFEGRLTLSRRTLAEAEAKLARAERDRELATAQIGQEVRAATDFRALVSMAVYGEPKAEPAVPTTREILWDVFAQCCQLEHQLAHHVNTARVRLKAALRRIVEKITVNLETGRYCIELRNGEKLPGGTTEFPSRHDRLKKFLGVGCEPEILLQPVKKSGSTMTRTRR